MKNVLIAAIGFSPNIGGIETHFDDLVNGLTKNDWRVSVLTYQPLNANVNSPAFEDRNGVRIFRIPVVRNFFYKLVDRPLLEFVYLMPGLFISLPIFLFFYGRKISVIHSHGLIAGFASVFWGKIFGKRVISTTHSIYNFPESGFYRQFSRWIFANSDAVLTLSGQSRNEIISLGIDKNKVTVFTYWIDLDVFKEIDNAKKSLGWNNKFVVLFVGRLIAEKGINELLDAASSWTKEIYLAVIGTGPLEKSICEAQNTHSNVIFLGSVENTKLPQYYSAADITIVPSVHEEGFGRVILESLACGTPVLGSNRGAIPEAMNSSVGKLITVTAQNIKEGVESLYYKPATLLKMAKNARDYACNKYSEANIKVIIDSYKERG